MMNVFFLFKQQFQIAKKTNTATNRLKEPPETPFHLVLREKILYDFWSILVGLVWEFLGHFESGENREDEVDSV